MTDPATFAGGKVSTLFAMGSGAGVSSLLMAGPWHVRLIAALSGAACTYVGTPIISPIAVKVWADLYGWMGVPVAELPRDSVVGFVGFLLGLTGVDVCRWMIERTKWGLKLLRLPPWRRGDGSGAL